MVLGKSLLMKMFFVGWVVITSQILSHSVGAQTPDDVGYRGIWFELNQKLPYGDKYSGGLGTYTAKHMPTAIYVAEAEKTFFVYGGTTTDTSRHLLCMIGYYDHRSKRVAKPKVVYDKKGVDDPHDNPSLLIDSLGHLWIFVSGRGTVRPGFKFRSKSPYDISDFEEISEEEMTYPQPWYAQQYGFFHFFTKYSGIRELYFESSSDGLTWTDDTKLAGIIEDGATKAGHYQISGQGKGKTGTFFNRHRNGHPDSRTDLYYVETSDFGQTWQTIDGENLEIPIVDVRSKAQVIDYLAAGKNVYLKDMHFDDADRPYALYLISNGHEPGPDNRPYQWMLTHWDDTKWISQEITHSDHNYDMGSLFVTDSLWQVVAPTTDGPQLWAAGGEVVVWNSTDRGKTWQETLKLTSDSQYNHSYVRRVHNGRTPFQFFWADGHGHDFSPSHLYFGSLDGRVWMLPYEMNTPEELPKQLR